MLTGLPNRALFFERLTRALADARTRASGVGVLFLDVDRFKEHQRHIRSSRSATRCSSSSPRGCAGWCGRTDTVARLGGDEFAVLLPATRRRRPRRARRRGMLAAIKAHVRAGTCGCTSARASASRYCGDGLDTPRDAGRPRRPELYKAKSAGRGSASITDARSTREARSDAGRMERVKGIEPSS